MKKTVSFSKNTTNLFFHVLTACNLSCRHCYINPEQHGEQALPLDTIKVWLRVFARKDRPANLVLLGGEPTLHPELPQAITAARELGYQSITVDTNGYLFNEIVDRVTPGQLDFFSFSLDGATRNTNDAIRGEGSYDRCLSGIKKAVAKGFGTSLIYTVSRANLGEIEKMPPLLKEVGVDRLFVQVLGKRGRAAHVDRQTEPVSREDWLSVVSAAALKIAQTGIRVAYPKVYLSPGEAFECAGLVADNYFVFPNGRVYRCPLCEDYPIHSLCFSKNRLAQTPPINESDLFGLQIPEGCVMNRLIQPENLRYRSDGSPMYRVSCCMLKEEVTG